MISEAMNAQRPASAAPLHDPTRRVGETTSERATQHEGSDEQRLLVQQQREIAHLQALVHEQHCELDRQVASLAHLQDAYDEQRLLVQQQQDLLV
jgi:hypothetical protein